MAIIFSYRIIAIYTKFMTPPGVLMRKIITFIIPFMIFLLSNCNYESGSNNAAVKYLISTAIDDGDHSPLPDDFATLFERELGSYDFMALMPNPLGSSNGVTFTVTGVTHALTTVTLDAGTVVIHMTMLTPNLVISMHAGGNLWGFIPINAGGSFTASSVVAIAEFHITVVSNDLWMYVDPSTVSVTINDPAVTFDNSVLDFLNGWISDLLVHSLTDGMEADLGNLNFQI